MHTHFVLAHPEPQSFNAHLVGVGADAFQSVGGTTSISDLYAAGFDPCERSEHYDKRLDEARFDVQAEQRHASDAASLPRAVLDELALLDRADLLVLQYPMWWHMPPAMLNRDHPLQSNAERQWNLARSPIVFVIVQETRNPRF